MNSYNFGESLDERRYLPVIDLIRYNDSFDEPENTENANDLDNVNQGEELTITDIRIAKVQFNTKCFEIVYSNNSSNYISYIQNIKRTIYSHNTFFNIACKNAVQKDITLV